MRSLLAMVLVLFFATPAVAGWHTYWVKENYSVTVHPSPVWTSSGWRVPSPYAERKTRWVQQRVWVNDLIYCTPIYVSPPIYCTPIYCTPIYVSSPIYCTPIYVSPPIYCTPIYSAPYPIHSSVVYPGVRW